MDHKLDLQPAWITWLTMATALAAALVLVLALGWSGSALAAAEGSCLVPRAAVSAIDGLGKAVDADERLSVLRPCVGRVKPQATDAVEVLLGTTGGSNLRLRVRAGESLQERIGVAIGPGNQLIDIWPDGSILNALAGWMSGKPRRTSGVSGFDGVNGTMPLKGDLARLPDTVLPLKVFGWSPDAPVTLTQAGKAQKLTPANGLLKLPLDRLAAGELRLEQAGHPAAVLTLLADADLGALRKTLNDIDTLDATPAQRAMLRSAALQQEQLLINAIIEYMKAR